LDEEDILLEVEQEDFISALHSLTPSITAQELAKYKNINTKLS
jgi:SpoVK/Ycf46/Vps4 family AAA+-type ATPase